METNFLAVLPERIRAVVRMGLDGGAEEIRIRAGRPVAIRGRGGRLEALECSPTQEECERILERVCAHSVFAYEEEIRECYVTLRDGSRVGLCGRTLNGGSILPHGFNIRLAREIPGAGDGLVKLVTEGGLGSALLISAPGAGKTTVLRDTARQLSMRGFQVAVADERGEIAAPVQGIPRLDLGGNTDVMSGCAKVRAMSLLIRAMAPQVLITDELATAGDAEAVLEASGCGVKVIASAHAGSAGELRRREGLMRAVRQGAFERIALLTNRDGVRQLADVTGEALCV